MTKITDKFITDKIILISKEKIILDIGGGERFQKWLAPYKDLFAGCDYRSMDYDDRTGADVVGDIHAIPLANDSLDAIICSSVLEHVRDPVRAVNELYRVVKKGGKVFVYVPSIYPYHARKGSYPDYWRFFEDTLLFMFKDFSSVEIKKAGGYFKTLSFFFPMQDKLKFILDPLSTVLDRLFSSKTTTFGYYLFATK